MALFRVNRPQRQSQRVRVVQFREQVEEEPLEQRQLFRLQLLADRLPEREELPPETVEPPQEHRLAPQLAPLLAPACETPHCVEQVQPEPRELVRESFVRTPQSFVHSPEVVQRSVVALLVQLELDRDARWLPLSP